MLEKKAGVSGFMRSGLSVVARIFVMRQVGLIPRREVLSLIQRLERSMRRYRVMARNSCGARKCEELSNDLLFLRVGK